MADEKTPPSSKQKRDEPEFQIGNKKNLLCNPFIAWIKTKIDGFSLDGATGVHCEKPDLPERDKSN